MREHLRAGAESNGVGANHPCAVRVEIAASHGVLYGTTERTCSTTGICWAKNRAFSAVTCAPPASYASRAVAAIAGTRLKRISAAGIPRSERLGVVAVPIVSARRSVFRP